MSTSYVTSATSTANTAARAAAAAPRTTTPNGPETSEREARGFALYVGLDEIKAITDGTSLASLVGELRAVIAKHSPSAETHAAVALAPRAAGGRDVDVVRLALHDPSAVRDYRRENHVERAPEQQVGVVIDISRQRVEIDGQASPLTYKEFELLQYLVRRPGHTVAREELINRLWSATDAQRPNDRTIDVHVRRLRAKLGEYGDIVRTVRGVGYRFDSHADVSVRHASTPSPDFF